MKILFGIPIGILLACLVIYSAELIPIAPKPQSPALKFPRLNAELLKIDPGIGSVPITSSRFVSALNHVRAMNDMPPIDGQCAIYAELTETEVQLAWAAEVSLNKPPGG